MRLPASGNPGEGGSEGEGGHWICLRRRRRSRTFRRPAGAPARRWVEVPGYLADETSGGESVAISYFSVPDGDGRWEFGLIALDPMRMAQDDPTLTDGDGYLRVWTGIASTRAVLERENGQNTQNVATSTMLDFAAQLDVPPQAAGQPSPRVLVFGSNSDEGVTVAFQTKFGACEQPVQGTALYDGFRVADVRLDGTSKVRLLLTDQFVTFVKSVATCEAGWDAANRPTVTCGPPGPLF